MSKVSILLPVYNSITRTERTDFLPQMINSVLKQTHTDFELLVLDNQSNDDTITVCQNAAGSDPRIKIQIDTQHRPAEEAHSRLIDESTGEFIMCMADDDILNTHYLQMLIAELDKDTSIDMAYSNGVYINVDNQIMSSLITNTDGVYNSPHYYENFYKAVHKRKVLPILYGVFRKDIFKSLMPYKPFDQLRANMDNLLMAKFFLHKYRTAFSNYNLFYYRHRNRSLNAESVDWLPTNPALIWVYYVRHQLNFYHAVCSFINENDHGKLTAALSVATLDSCLNQCGNLLNWVERDLIRDAFEHSIIQEIRRQFDAVYSLRASFFAHTPESVHDQQDILRLRCKILQERVLEYIKNILQDTILVQDTQNIIEGIKKELIKQLNS